MMTEDEFRLDALASEMFCAFISQLGGSLDGLEGRWEKQSPKFKANWLRAAKRAEEVLIGGKS